MKKFALFFATLFFISGCLVTRQDVRNSVKSEPLTPEQQRRSSSEVRMQEVDEQMRQMNGRIEVLENSMNMLNADKSGSQIERDNERKVLTEKLKIYEETLTKLDQQYLLLSQKVEALQMALTAKPSGKASETDKNSFEQAEDEFGKKKWKEAIVAFEKYRTLNPKGKKYGEATYKIGSSFNELGMKTEAKAFYSEVIEKFPKSDWAKKAQQRLKTMK